MTHDSREPGTRILQRGDTTTNWATDNPVLMEREVGWDLDLLRVKIGDGVTAWNSLPYAIDGPEGEVDTVAGVTPVAGDIPEAALKTALELPTDTVTALAGKVPDTRQVNGHALSSDVTVTKGDVGLGNVDNTSDAAKPVSTAQQSALDAKAARTTLGLPSYFPTASVNPFDTKSGAYNFKLTNTRKLRAALGRANAGGFCELVAIGDSTSAGCTSSTPSLTYDRLRAWPVAARDELTRHGLIMGGTGIVRTTDGQVSTDSRWGFTGTWSAANKTFASLAGAGTATLTNSSISTGLSGSYDRAVVYYYDFASTGAFSITVKNQAGTTIGTGNVTETSAGWKRATVNLSPSETGSGTILITRTTGTIAIMGAQWFSSSGGVIVENIAQSSSRASGTDGKIAWEVADANANSLCNVFAAPTRDGTTPDAVFIGLGINDIQNGITSAAFKTALTTIRNRYSGADAFLVATNQPADAFVSAAAWEAFVVAMYELADTLDVPLLDFRARLGNWTTMVANGQNGDTVGHLTAAAYAGLGRAAGLLLAS